MEEYDTETEVNMVSENEEDNATDCNDKLTLKARKVKRSNGKWKLCYANRCFKKEWLELFPWVEEDPEDSKFAICRACNKKMKAHKGILETHQRTKRHLKHLSGSDDIDDDDEPVKKEKPAPKMHIPPQPQMEQALTDDQMSFFTESPMDSAHHAITSLIDKLVEKYHENRLENLKVQNGMMMELHAQRAGMLRAEKQRKYERHVQLEMHKQQELEIHLSFMQQQHETRINAMEEERDAKLKAVEQQLVFARQEYERKVKLLDQQLQFIK